MGFNVSTPLNDIFLIKLQFLTVRCKLLRLISNSLGLKISNDSFERVDLHLDLSLKILTHIRTNSNIIIIIESMNIQSR